MTTPLESTSLFHAGKLIRAGMEAEEAVECATVALTASIQPKIEWVRPECDWRKEVQQILDRKADQLRARIEHMTYFPGDSWQGYKKSP